MIYEAGKDDGDRFKAAVWMGREARHNITMVHAPAIFERKILTNVATRQRSRRAQLRIAARVGVIMVGAEQKWVTRLPLEPKRSNINNRFVIHVEASRSSDCVLIIVQNCGLTSRRSGTQTGGVDLQPRRFGCVGSQHQPADRERLRAAVI